MNVVAAGLTQLSSASRPAISAATTSSPTPRHSPLTALLAQTTTRSPPLGHPHVLVPWEQAPASRSRRPASMARASSNGVPSLRPRKPPTSCAPPAPEPLGLTRGRRLGSDVRAHQTVTLHRFRLARGVFKRRRARRRRRRLAPMRRTLRTHSRVSARAHRTVSLFLFFYQL